MEQSKPRQDLRLRLTTWAIWASMALLIAFLSWLPWLWSRGGTLPLVMEPSVIAGPKRIEATDAVHPVWLVDWRSFLGGVIRKNTQQQSSFFFRPLLESGSEPSALLALYEDGRLLGPVVENALEVSRRGQGSYSLKWGTLQFSTTDDTSPRTNNRRYSVEWPREPRREWPQLLLLACLWLGSLAGAVTLVSNRRRMVFLVERCEANRTESVLVFALVAIFTAHSFFCAKFEPRGLLILLTAISGLYLIVMRRRLVLRGWLLLLLLFGLLGAVTIFFDSAGYASWTVVLKLLLGLVVFWTMLSAAYGGLSSRGGQASLLVSLLVPMLAVAMLVQNSGFDLKSALASLDGWGRLSLQAGNWNQKFQETWLAVLAWCMIGASQFRGRTGMLWNLSLIGLSALAILSGYSSSVKLAFALSLVLFLAALGMPRAVRRLTAVAFIGWVFLAPMFVGGLWKVATSTSVSGGGVISPHVSNRLVTWEYSRQLIMERPWLGWGLGSSAGLPGARRGESAGKVMGTDSEVPADWSAHEPLAGGHPHSLPLLLWLETGAVGVLLSVVTLLLLFRTLGRVTDRVRHGAFLALGVFLFGVFCLNYPVWQLRVQILLIMTFALVGAIGSRREQSRDEALEGSTGGALGAIDGAEKRGPIRSS